MRWSPAWGTLSQNQASWSPSSRFVLASHWSINSVQAFSLVTCHLGGLRRCQPGLFADNPRAPSAWPQACSIFVPGKDPSHGSSYPHFSPLRSGPSLWWSEAPTASASRSGVGSATQIWPKTRQSLSKYLELSWSARDLWFSVKQTSSNQGVLIIHLRRLSRFSEF